MIYPMRLRRAESVQFKLAAKRQGVSLAEFLRQAGRHAAQRFDAAPASLELSRSGFTLPDLPGKTEREKIRAAIAKRHVSR
jgi:hypothetical protein